MAIIPTISSIRANAAAQLVLTWEIPTTSVRNYKIYRDLVEIGISVGKANNTFIDTTAAYGDGVSYSYNVSVIDFDEIEGDLSDTYVKDFETSDLMLDHLYTYLLANGAQNMKLIVGEEEIPVLTAMEEYIDDVIIAIDHPVVFDADFRDRTADNIVSFWYIPQDDLWGYRQDPNSPYEKSDLKTRRFRLDSKINNKISNVMSRIYQDANYFFNL